MSYHRSIEIIKLTGDKIRKSYLSRTEETEFQLGGSEAQPLRAKLVIHASTYCLLILRITSLSQSIQRISQIFFCTLDLPWCSNKDRRWITVKILWAFFFFAFFNPCPCCTCTLRNWFLQRKPNITKSYKSSSNSANMAEGYSPHQYTTQRHCVHGNFLNVHHLRRTRHLGLSLWHRKK